MRPVNTALNLGGKGKQVGYLAYLLVDCLVHHTKHWLMKNVFFTIIFLLAATAGFAQARRAILKVRLSDQSPLTVTIDNRVYEKHGRSITIGDLPAGSHYVKVYEYRAYRDADGGHAKLLYAGNIRTKRNTVTTCTVDPNTGRVRVRTQPLGEEEEWNDRRDPDQRYDSRNTLNRRDMEDLKQRADERITDTDKMKLLKSALGNSSYYTDQVQQIMGWLSFESSKLEFAKWAYAGVVDAKNYWKLESEFSFSSSKDEFNEYIQGR